MFFQKGGYQIILANTNNDLEEELKSLSLFRDNQVDGVVFIATMFTRKHRQMLKEYKVSYCDSWTEAGGISLRISG